MRGRGGIIVAVVAVVLALALVFFFLVRPRQGELAQVNEDIEAAEQETIQLRTELERLEALQQDAPRLQAQLTEVRELVPAEDQIPNFIFQVQAAANSSGLRFVRIVPELPDPPLEGGAAGGLAEIRVTIGTTGGYFAIQDFVRRLYRLDRALRIDVISIVPEEEGSTTLDFEAVARIFFEAPAGAATGTGTTTTPAPAPAPAATPAPSPSPSPAEGG